VLAYKPETLIDYETGAKLSLLDGRARLAADAFYYDYRNYQAFLLRNLTQIIGNADATLYGGELELAVIPLHGLTLEGGLSLLSTRISKLALPDGSLADREMPNAPHWSLNALARYEWPGAGGTWSLQLDGKWNAAQWLENVNAPVDLQPGFGVVNLRAGFASGHDWDVTAWVRNATDKQYRVYNLDLSGLGYNESVYGSQRWIGVTLDYRWGN